MSAICRFACVGMLACVSAGVHAADLASARLAPPPPAAPIVSWTGFYAGGQIGYARGSDITKEYVTASMTYVGLQNRLRPDGVLGGFHVGANYQYDNFVAGLEGDFELTSVSGGFIDPPAAPFNPGGLASTQIRNQGSVRGRLGYAFGPALLYGTGGFAAASFRSNYWNWAGTGESFSRTLTGFTVGGGVEYLLTTNVSARLEYRHTKFDLIRNDSVLAYPGFSGTQEPHYHSGRFALSYHF